MCIVSQPLESSQLDAIQIKKGIADCNVHNKNKHSFLSRKRKSQYHIPILAIVCVPVSPTKQTDMINI